MMPTYEERVAGQIEQFSDHRMILPLPEAHKYWMRNFVQKKVQAVFDVRNHLDFYVRSIRNAKRHKEICSIGSGDGALEVQLCQHLLKLGVKDFKIHLTELSDVRMNRAKSLVHTKGLDEYFEFHLIDFNKEFLEQQFDLIIAHHVLHHIVELELLFKNVRSSLKSSGTFSSIDMIGRNGHQRWPETLKIAESFWNFIPASWKYNFQFQQYHENYLNFDCSGVGFEGIRSQDILPVLIENFDFAGFVGEGGFVDVILERGYGQNINMNNQRDRSLVEMMCEFNEALLETGRIKPTLMFAEMKRKSKSSPEPMSWKGMTPDFCMRETK